MKMNIYFKGLVVSLLLIAGMFTSCEDQPDKFELTGGLPQVSYIRMPYLAQSDSLIVEASLKSIICLVVITLQVSRNSILMIKRHS